MAVIINDFEVVAEPLHQGEDAVATAPASAASVKASTPHDIERVMRRLDERLARVRAH